MPENSLKIEMVLGGKSSNFVLGPLAGLDLKAFVPQGPPVYIVDRMVATRHSAWIQQIQNSCRDQEQPTLLVDGGESLKSLDQLGQIFSWLAEKALPRDGTIVAIGGGTVLDLVGLAASTWRRGVNLVNIPTTLLAMVDASIGGKTAINTGGLKNPVGTFHPAGGILSDTGFLWTLNREEWRNGLAEMIKTAIIGDGVLFADLHDHRPDLARTLGQGPPDQPIAGILGSLPWARWVGRAARVKADIVSRDFREGGARKALNLGHTLGHALEAHSHRTDHPLSHGQAVSIGMAVVFRLAAERGQCPLDEALQVLDLLKACGLPVSCPAPPRDQLVQLLAGDKKTTARAGLSWVLPERIGKVTLQGRVEAEELLRWLEQPASD